MANFMFHTNHGLRKVGRAWSGGTTITIAAVGVGLGSPGFDRTRTGLMDERFRLSPTRVYYPSGTSAQVIVEAIVPVTNIIFPVREVALYDSTGSCVAIGLLTRVQKSADDRMLLRMYLALPKHGVVAEQAETAPNLSEIAFPEGAMSEREIRPGTLVMIHDRDPSKYQIIEVQSVTADLVTLAEPRSDTWGKGSRITPLRVARMNELPQIENITDRVGKTTARFEILDTDAYEPQEDWGYCAPLFRFKIDWATAVSISHDRSVEMFESTMGARQVIDPGQRDRSTTRVAVKLYGRDEVWAYRRFLAAARGKTVRFWAPSFTMDIEPLGAIGGDYIDAADSGYSLSFIKPQDSRLVIAIEFDDGRPTIYRKLTSVVPLLTGERYYLDVPIPGIARNEINRIYFVVPSRFDQDAFELRHHVDGSKAVSAAVVLKSAEITDMPDIECFVTSKPYPVDAAEAIAPTMTVTGIAMQEFAPVDESIETSTTVTAGTLVNALITYTDEPHGIETTLTVTEGTLT